MAQAGAEPVGAFGDFWVPQENAGPKGTIEGTRVGLLKEVEEWDVEKVVVKAGVGVVVVWDILVTEGWLRCVLIVLLV